MSTAPVAAAILADTYPAIVGFDDTGMTTEQVHWHLGESAAVAYYQYQHLTERRAA